MKTAYLYVRVSTDEQKRKGYSLPEQEDRLLKHCDLNNIKVKGIFREDFSAKNFNRPEWKKLLSMLKRSSTKEVNNILFIKWDRFSRNIEYAYEMIGILRKHNATAMAIDQPIDFEIPESTVMLAVYLAVPEAENARRSLNTSNGMRRAKLMGRHPNRAPIGYINMTAPDGRKYIIPNESEAAIIKWAFEQLSKNAYSMEEVRRMVNAKGLQCSRSHFWKILHNPIYCGHISLFTKGIEERQWVKGIHQPLISEDLFNDVQNVINTKRKFASKTDESNQMFILRKYLVCPICNKKLTGSFSKGKTKRYPYYHCGASCKARFKADLINDNYVNKLKQLQLLPMVNELFSIILCDVNADGQRNECLSEQKLLLRQIADQESFILKARKLFVSGKIQFDDFSILKQEHYIIATDLRNELDKVTTKLECLDKQNNIPNKSFRDIFNGFKDSDINDKKRLINIIPPVNINNKGDFGLQLNSSISKILLHGLN